MTRSTRIRGRALLAAGALALTTLWGAGVAEATPARTTAVAAVGIPIDWEAETTSHLTTLNQDITFAGGRFVGSADPVAGTLEGELDLPDSSISGTALGLIPFKTDVRLVPESKVTGTLDLASGQVTASYTFRIVITDFQILGLPINLLDPAQECTSPPITTKGLAGTLDLTKGVTLNGTYDIPSLSGCGDFWGFFLNLFTVGNGNTITSTITIPPAA